MSKISKLTLSMEAELIKKAKEHSQRTGQSVSELVAKYFQLLDSENKSQNTLPPAVRSLIGILHGDSFTEKDYDHYLEDKYS